MLLITKYHLIILAILQVQLTGSLVIDEVGGSSSSSFPFYIYASQIWYQVCAVLQLTLQKKKTKRKENSHIKTLEMYKVG